MRPTPPVQAHLTNMNKELFVISIKWDSIHGSPLIGPIVGLTRTRQICTLIRKRLRENHRQFQKVTYHPVQSLEWFMKFPFMKDSVDRLLDTVFSDRYELIDTDV